MTLTAQQIFNNVPAQLERVQIGHVYAARVHGQQKFSTSAGSPYPDWDETDIPVKIIGDYGMWWLVDVLPHTPAHPVFGSPSKPYTVSIDKWDVLANRITLKEAGR
jgi:hypothetical protein